MDTRTSAVPFTQVITETTEVVKDKDSDYSNYEQTKLRIDNQRFPPYHRGKNKMGKKMGKLNEQKINIKNEEVIILRSATQEDANKVTDLTHEVYKTSHYLITTLEEFSPLSEEHQKERLKKYVENDGSIFIVAEYDNQLIGMINFQNNKEKRIAHKGSFGMSIRLSWRNKGVGNALLSELIKWVKKHPTIEIINLGVLEENKSAIALYSKFGFEIIGREPFGIKLSNGNYLADLGMSLRVSK